MQLPRVIGITGLKRSGKSTLARQLAALGYENVAFADPLRDLAYRFNNYIDETGCRLAQVIDEYGWEYAKDNYPEVRHILQFLGTEVVREVKQTHWTDQMRQRIADPEQRFVVSDVRFENEAQVVRDNGGFVVEIVRPGLVLPKDGHVSEAGVVADWVLYNTGTPEELYHDFLGEISDL